MADFLGMVGRPDPAPANGMSEAHLTEAHVMEHHAYFNPPTLSGSA